MISKEDAREKIEKLIERYNKIKDDPEQMRNERQVCDTLIRPFFRDILEWEIEDPYEFKSEYQQGGKRIDYMACIEGISQFVIEAKAPSREIKDNSQFYRQAIQYAEGKGRDFAILTNFRTFIILRAGIDTVNPLINEVTRIDILNLTDSKLDFLLCFNKKFWIEKGEENPLYSIKNLKRKRPLDEALVEDMSKWRESLLKSLKAIVKDKYNFDDEKNLEYIEEEVQRFIDRLIFMCYCEDKQLTDNELKPLLQEYRSKHVGKKTFIVGQIKKLFETYNRVYNSDLFKKGFCDEFEFDDNILFMILEDLRGYYDALPYDFSVIDADILGRAYENFLGHITIGKTRFKEKKDIGKRKKHGIYYTPQHIVNYIVLNTVREKVRGKSFQDIMKIKILDPACGSGSFLIKAFDVLVEESKLKLKRDLIYEEKEELMLNCIYGVDLDERACDIAKLNLSLKLAERNKKLPALYNNIKNGNSLIDDKSIDEKAFNWNDKINGFGDVMDKGGFDIVIGNPPWSSKIPSEVNEFLAKKFLISQKNMNIFGVFVIHSLKLLKKNGLFGLLIPKVIIKNDAYTLIRKEIIENYSLFKVMDFGQFPGVASDAVCLLIENKKGFQPINVQFFEGSKLNTKNKIEKDIFSKSDSFVFSLSTDNKIQELLDKIVQNSKKLSELFKIKRGIELGQKSFIVQCNKCGFYNEANTKYYGQSDKKCKKCDTKLVINDKSIKIISSEKEDKDYNSEAIAGNQLQRYNLSDKYYILSKLKGIDYKEMAFEGPKILIKRINTRIEGTFLKSKLFAFNTVYSLYGNKNENSYLSSLAILNSKLMRFYYEFSYNVGMNLTTQVTIDFLSKIPIHLPSPTQEQKIISLVNKTLSLQKEYHNEKSLRKDKIKENIDKIDSEIDSEVYKLYRITKEEQKIIEESLR